MRWHGLLFLDACVVPRQVVLNDSFISDFGAPTMHKSNAARRSGPLQEQAVWFRLRVDCCSLAGA